MPFWDNADKHIRIAETSGTIYDSHARQMAVRQLGAMRATPKILACLKGIILNPRTDHWLSAEHLRDEALRALAWKDSAEAQLALLDAVESAARLNINHPPIFGMLDPTRLRMLAGAESPPALLRAGLALLAHGDGFDIRLDSCRDVLQRLATPIAHAALGELDAATDVRQRAFVDTIRDTALASGNTDDVVGSIRKLMRIHDPRAKEALAVIKRMPERKLEKFGWDLEEQAGYQRETKPSLLRYELEGAERERWDSIS